MKKILIVVKDNLETKLLLNNFVLNHYLKNKEIHILTKVNKKFYNEEILKIRQDVVYLKYSFVASRFSKFLYKISFFFEHLSNVQKSISSYQKILFLLNFNSKIVLNKIFYKKSLPFLKHIQIIGSFFNFNYLNILLKINTDSSFDYIFFSRPDDLDNLLVHNTYGSRKTKILTLIRNFDTACLKRLFVVPSDMSFYFDYKIKQLCKINLTASKYGKLSKFPYYIDSCKSQEYLMLKNEFQPYVIYATTQKEFFSNKINEEELINYILKILAKRNIKLVIRVHPNHKSEYQKLKLKGDFVIQNELYTLFSNKDNGEIEMLTQKDIVSYMKLIKNAKFLLTNGSTISYDAYKLGVNAYFINLDDDWMLYEREHLVSLINIGIQKLTSIEELGKVINES